MDQNMNFIEVRPHRKLHLVHFDNKLKRTIFFLHGLGGRLDQFKAQIDYFKKNYNIVAADMLGHGDSQKPRENANILYSFAELYQDIQILFSDYQTEENFIVGHSYGGTFATYLTFNNPDKIKKLVLMAPLPLNPQIAITKFFYLPIPLLELIRPLVTKAFVKIAFDRHTDPALIQHEIEMTNKNPMFVIKACTQGLLKLPSIAIDQIKTPTLIITGENDGLIPFSQINNFYQKLPHAEFIKIKNAAHLVMLEQPVKVNQLIEKFLSS